MRTAYGYGGPAHAAQEEADTARAVEIFAGLCESAPSVEVELFFDGAFRPLGGGPPNLRVRFARETSADELILDRVRARAFGGKVATVVTADAALGREAEAEGGRWLRVERGQPPEAVARRIGGRFAR